MKKMKWLVVFMIFVNINCRRGLVKEQAVSYKVNGAVSYKDEILSGAEVEIFLENEVLKDGFSGKPLISLKTDPDGKFTVSLPKNNYYFRAWKSGEKNIAGLKEGDYFCYYGGNPVVAVDSIQDLILKCARVHNIKTDNTDILIKPKLTGNVIDTDGRALENACVHLFSASNPEFRRMADVASEPTLKDGSFSITLDTAGSYFVMVRKRRNAEEKGPLKIGDYYGYYYANPLEIKDKTESYLLIECIEKKKEQPAVNMVSIPAGKAAIRGRITDKNGDPVSGMFAFTYKDEFNTGKKPDYKSMITGKDGAYTIIIEEAGSYILGARKTHGGPSEPGDIFGFYGGSRDNKVEIKKSEILSNINITVEDVK